jgi:hypothetical protein
MMALGYMPEEIRDDPQKWASCVSGAEERDVYLDRLTEAGFVNISITEEGKLRSQEDGLPDMISVKVVAYKPA